SQADLRHASPPTRSGHAADRRPARPPRANNHRPLYQRVPPRPAPTRSTLAHPIMMPRSITSLVRRSISHRRKMGFGFRETAARLLNFARYADRIAPGRPLTSAIAMEWAALPGDNRLGYHAKRLKLVRGFALYCAALDPRTEVPPSGVF